jgi:transposase-like protein
MENIVNQIIEKILSLPLSRQKAIQGLLNQKLNNEQKIESTIISVRQKNQQHSSISCPHCKGESIVGYGKYRDSKRYKCKSCNKTFNDLTGTSVSHIKKKKEWEQYLLCLSEGLSLRAAAARVKVSYRTSFLWRHKIIGSFHDVGCSKLGGIVEGDETFFLYSEKGNKNIKGRAPRRRGGKASKAGINDEQVAVIVASDRHKHSIVEVAGRSRITAEKIQKAIGKWIPEDVVALCSDSHKSYEKFARDRAMKHITINASKGQHVKDKVFHIQNVNSMHHFLKDWIRRFNGVASKYLQNYMNWFRIQRTTIGNIENYLQLALTSNSAFVSADKLSTHYVIS